jgi:hypothetical protein
MNIREEKINRATSLLLERKNGETGLGLKARFASVQDFAEEGHGLDTLVRGLSEREGNWLSREPEGVHGSSWVG